jgi:hypothetical protein
MSSSPAVAAHGASREPITQERQVLSPTIGAVPDDVREADHPPHPERLVLTESDRPVVRDDLGPEPHLGVDDVEERPLAAPGKVSVSAGRRR